jgi:hypothetical protein
MPTLSFAGLGVVEAVVEMAIHGERVYSSASNALLGWEQGNYFAAGVNTAKLLNILLSTNDLATPEKRAEVVGLAQLANTTSMARRPGGQWVPCHTVPTHNAMCLTVPWS